MAVLLFPDIAYYTFHWYCFLLYIPLFWGLRDNSISIISEYNFYKVDFITKDRNAETTGDYTDKIQYSQGAYTRVEKISTGYINQDHILIYPPIKNLLRIYCYY